MPSDKFLQILHDNWGYDNFRGIQREIIESIASGKDTLGLMPTGGGKSITFQVPALACKGVCIVITPLIALMRDQVMQLRKKNIRAAAIYGTMTHQEILTTLDNSVLGGIDLLYISPERLSSELFQTKLRHINVSFITVDEAHCISQWGYDFRPSYLQIASIRLIKPDAPILALTATATPQVTEDIQKQLGFRQPNLFKMSFVRKNLAYVVRHTHDKDTEAIHILKSVTGCAIIYVRNRQSTKDVAKMLEDSGISATSYNAGLEPAVRNARQAQWVNNEKRVMVATNAFGMGIDKPDVRLVIHLDCPDSIEAYFQEAGRAGRDGNKAYAVMLYNDSDRAKLERRVDDNFPPHEYIQKVYGHLASFYQVGAGSGLGHRFEFNIDRFCHAFRHFPTKCEAALRLLTRAGYIDYDENSDDRARVRFLVDRNDLYKINNMTNGQNTVLTELLRNYTGMFTDFVFIDETFLAQQAALSVHDTYTALKSLSERNIIRFVPRNKIPHITYTRQREDHLYISLPAGVYEERKEQYRQRVNSVICYATNNEVCRSRQLVRYFGETDTGNCGMCDVCLDHKHQEPNASDTAHAKRQITALLADGRPHTMAEVLALNLPTADADYALQWLISENIIANADGKLTLRRQQ